MTRRLLIVGAGYAGLRIAARATERGFDVTATTRSPTQREALEAIGAHVVPWTVGEPLDALTLSRVDDVIYAVPPTETPAPFAELTAGKRFVYLSSASVYGDHGGAPIDERSACQPTSPVGQARKAIEDELLAVGDDVRIVRIVGIYGPDRTLDRYLAGGRYKLVDGGLKITNRIHVDDLAEVVLAALERGRAGRVYLAADGNPVRVRDLVQWLVDHRGITWPEEVTLEEYRAQRGDDAAERWANSYAAGNARIREELGVQLRHEDVFAGYAAIFGGQVTAP